MRLELYHRQDWRLASRERQGVGVRGREYLGHLLATEELLLVSIHVEGFGERLVVVAAGRVQEVLRVHGERGNVGRCFVFTGLKRARANPATKTRRFTRAAYMYSEIYFALGVGKKKPGSQKRGHCVTAVLIREYNG